MSIKTLILVVPDDHGGMGMDQVGQVLVYEEGVIAAWWLMDPGEHRVERLRKMNPGRSFWEPWVHHTMTGNFTSVRSLAEWTSYAVAEIDGTLVYQPEGVYRYARRDPELWL